MGVVYLVPFLLRGPLGLTTLESGLLLSLKSISMIICCVIVGRCTNRSRDRMFAVLSCVLMTVYAVMMLLVQSDSAVWYIGICLLVEGTIWGVGGGPIGTRMVNVLDDKDRGSGSSMVTFVMYFSSALGTALFAGLFGFGSGIGGADISSTDPATFLEGFGFAMMFGVLFAVVALVLSAAVREGRLSHGE